MPRRRDTVQRAVSAVVEHLEKRTLLTTIVGGGMDPLTGLPIVTSLTYRDNHNKVATIYVGGNTTVEAIFTDVNGFAAPLGGPARANGSDLFHLFVAQADKNSFVAVTEINPLTGALIPFTADAGTFRVANATTGQLVNINPNGGTGGLILGAHSQNTGNAATENIPITAVRFSGAFGARPDLGQRNIVAGFQVADGVDFGRFYFDGTITGAVIAGGSIDQMYAGNIFTGATQGTFLGGVGRRTPNFKINGDLHSLLVSGSIGTHTLTAGLNRPTYSSDFDGQVLGRIGGVTVRDSLLGGWDAINNPVTQSFGSQVEEVEGLNAFNAGANDREVWALGYLAGNASIRNDTFATPQILPSYPGRKGRSGVVAHGTLEAGNAVADNVDYYGMPLLAGQSITVSLTLENGQGFVGSMNVGIFDPDGRLVATDYPNVPNGLSGIGQPIRYTADRPGLYRIAVAAVNDVEFTGAGSAIGDSPYFLSVGEGGNLGFAGISAASHVSDGQLSEAFGFFTENGDFGGVYSGGTVFSQTDLSMVVRKGHLRGIEGNQIGVAVGGATFSVNLFIPRGTVGLVRSTGGNMALNEDFLPLPVGGDYQVVSAAATMLSNLVANRRIGVIRAANTATATPSVWTVNADDTGNDGIIDLIDVPGQFGTLGSGGPQITTNTEGNVRYMHVGYNGGTVFRDAFFGSGDALTEYGPGESVTNINDDSGARMEFEPFPLTSNPAFVPGGTNPANIGPQITLGTYGIRGSGGVAVFQVDVNGSIRIGVGGGRGRGSHAEIGAINDTGAGNPVIRSTASGTLVFALPTGASAANTNVANLEVNFDGSGRADVWQINGSDFTSIRNGTAGEIVNIDATVNPRQVPGFPVNNGTIGSLKTTSVGITKNFTGAALNPLGVVTGGNNFPFVQQHTGIVSGNVLNVQTSGGVGNFLVTGDIGNITANAGGKNNTGAFEGINAPIFASGAIDSVSIGNGILPSGSGDVSFSGIYAQGAIGAIANQGLGSDVRGDIYTGSSIGSVTLHDGAFIGAHVAHYTQPNMMRNNTPLVVIPQLVQPINNPIFDIGSIAVGGAGGIIGTLVESSSMGPISVTRGFGILNSQFSNTSSQRMDSITAEGYGIRSTLIEGGAHVSSVSATAKGKNISVLNYSPSVRQSERTSIDPFFQAEPNAETDLHKFFGTSFHTPQIRGVTEPGMIGNTAIRMGNDVGSVFANTIVNSNINAGNNIGRVRTRGDINAFSITTGQLKSYLGGANASGLAFTVAGPINDFHQAGDISSDSTVRAIGGSGRIVDFVVDGDLNGKVTSTNSWHQLLVGGDLGPTGFIQSRLPIEIRTIKGNIFGTIKIG